MYQKRRDVMCAGLAGGRLACRGAEGDDVRVGENSRAVREDGVARVFEEAAERGARSRCRPASASANTATITCVIALIENEARTRQAVRGIKEMFRKDGLL